MEANAIFSRGRSRKAEIERLYRDILAGEFQPLQYGKQTEAFGNHLLGNSIVA